MKKKILPPAVEKQYIVLCDGELWLTGTRQDIIDDFNDDAEAYVKHANEIKIYELSEPIPFSFVTPQINF
jgi:hypothetical protein